MGPRSRDRGIDWRAIRASRTRALQWGRGHVTAESPTYEQTAQHIGQASMGPRSRDRGISVNPFVVRSADRASMGPRSRDRGIVFVRLTGRETDEGFNGAAVT